MNESSPYRYRPLTNGPHSIRLLRLKPDTGEAEIRCEIFNYRLRPERPSGLYEALSYVWGNLNHRRLFVDDSSGAQAYLDVTTNLHAALCRLRDPDVERIVWVDALCINQEDLEERGSQVQFMASIYAFASRVVVWLGEGEFDCVTAFDLIRKASDAQQRDSHEVGAPKRTRQSSNLKALVNLPWFCRIWVLQEVAAARFVLFMYGPQEITGGVFCRGLQALKYYYEHDRQIQGIVGSIIRLTDWQPIHDINRSTRLNIMPLPELIDMFHSRSATDPRDKVYALLGMSSDSFHLNTLKADYSKSWYTLFHDLGRTIFGFKADITVLETPKSAIIRVKSLPVGRIQSVQSNIDSSGRQRLQLSFYETQTIANLLDNLFWTTQWIIESTSKAIKKGDLLCLLQGAQNPTIVRLRQDHASIVSATIKVPKKDMGTKGDYSRLQGNTPFDSNTTEWSKRAQQVTDFPVDTRLTWDWDSKHEEVKKSGTISPNNHFLLSSALKDAMDNIMSQKQRLLRMSSLLDHIQDEPAFGECVQEASKLETPGDPLHFTVFLGKLRLVHQNWASYVLLKKVLHEWVEPLGTRIPQIDLRGVLLVLDKRRGDIVRFLPSLVCGQHAQISGDILFYECNKDCTEPAAQLLLRLLDGFTLSQEDLRYTVTHRVGVQMMRILSLYTPDDATTLESAIKTAIENTVFDFSILNMVLHVWQDDVPISEDLLRTASQQSTPLSFNTIINRSELTHKPRVTFSVVHAIAKNKSCGPELLKLAFKHEKQELPITREILDVMSQNRSRGGEMLTFILGKTRAVNIFPPILELLGSAPIDQLKLAVHGTIPTKRLKLDVGFWSSSRMRCYETLISYFELNRETGTFEGKSGQEISEMIYDHFDCTGSQVGSSQTPLLRLRKDLELAPDKTVADLIFERIEIWEGMARSSAGE